MIPDMAAPLEGPVSMNIPFSPRSAAQVRAALESWLGHRGSAPQVVDDARLVATELVGNAVRHATPLDNGTVLVRWRADGSALLLSVCDGGGPTSPARYEPTTEEDHGRGLAIVEALSATWWTERHSRLHAIHVRLDLD